MHVTPLSPPWLLLVFSLPTSRASQRVEVWRKLQKNGTLPLRSAGHVLPNTAGNLEKLEWLARSIRGYHGEATVAQVRSFDDLPDARLRQLFIEARAKDYQRLLRDLQKVLALSAARRPAGRLNQLRRRWQEIVAVDFFESPWRKRVESVLARADEEDAVPEKARTKAAQYRNKMWITRPRPGIDRVSSAWLIKKFIDPRARFQFADEAKRHPEAIPFDMFGPEGFGHRGDDCTFETLCKEFAVRNRRVRRIAQIVHDADLGDEKFGMTEGAGLDCVLNGWARQANTDHELLRRGMELIDGLYESAGGEK